MHQPGQVGGGVVAAGARQQQLVREVAFVERGDDLTGAGLVALVDGQGFDSPVNLECEIDLADIDVALEDELGVFLRRCVREDVP